MENVSSISIYILEHEVFIFDLYICFETSRMEIIKLQFCHPS